MGSERDQAYEQAPAAADAPPRARAGDAGVFRLLVERHSLSARARAARLCGRADDVDDIVQEAFLQAFMALDWLRDPDRFGAWLGGIIRNVHRAAGRQERLMLLAEWREGLHPVSAQGLPSAEDLDRAEALRAAVADLPDGQRRAVELYYYAGLPAGQIAGSPGASKASLHKARRRLRTHITAHRPDLIRVTSRRTAMTTVRIACAEPHMDTRMDGSPAIGHIPCGPGRRSRAPGDGAVAAHPPAHGAVANPGPAAPRQRGGPVCEFWHTTGVLGMYAST